MAGEERKGEDGSRAHVGLEVHPRGSLARHPAQALCSLSGPARALAWPADGRAHYGSEAGMRWGRLWLARKGRGRMVDAPTCRTQRASPRQPGSTSGPRPVFAVCVSLDVLMCRKYKVGTGRVRWGAAARARRFSASGPCANGGASCASWTTTFCPFCASCCSCLWIACGRGRCRCCPHHRRRCWS